MGKTSIEWTQMVWNPVTGCTRVSPGCDHCYMFRQWPRLRGMGVKGYEGEPEHVALHPERLTQPLRWKKPRMIFTCSMSDLFHPRVPWSFILDVFFKMWIAEKHTFQVLTKRPGRMAYFANHVLPSSFHSEMAWPSNVWAGTSVEQEWDMTDGKRRHLIARLDAVARVPAPVRFVSVEPLLGPLDLLPYLMPDAGYFGPGNTFYPLAPLSWVIVGGESGPGARPMHPDWVRSIRDQCQEAGVPFFFKQWGEYVPTSELTGPDAARKVWKGSRYIFPSDFGPLATGQQVFKVGKKDAGALLDGREWREMP